MSIVCECGNKYSDGTKYCLGCGRVMIDPELKSHIANSVRPQQNNILSRSKKLLDAGVISPEEFRLEYQIDPLPRYDDEPVDIYTPKEKRLDISNIIYGILDECRFDGYDEVVDESIRHSFSYSLDEFKVKRNQFVKRVILHIEKVSLLTEYDVKIELAIDKITIFRKQGNVILDGTMMDTSYFDNKGKTMIAVRMELEN